MKRNIADQFSELDNLNRKIAGLDCRIEYSNRKILRHEKEKASEEQALLIKTFPVFKENTPPSKYFNYDPHKYGITIRHIFNLSELVALIFDHLGPCEIYALTRVARDFKALVELVFPQIGGSLLRHYTLETIVNPTPTRLEDVLNDIKEYESLLVDYTKASSSKRPDIEKLLYLWYHCMCVTKGYHRRSIELNDSYYLDYAFVYDFTEKRLMPMRDLNLYYIEGLDNAKKSLNERLKRTYETEVEIDQTDSIVQFFRHNELSKVRFVRIEDIVKQGPIFIIKHGEIVPFSSCLYTIYYCDPFYTKPSLLVNRFGSVRPLPKEVTLANLPENRNPFFDHYAERLALVYCKKHEFPLSLSNHLDSMKISLLV